MRQEIPTATDADVRALKAKSVGNLLAGLEKTLVAAKSNVDSENRAFFEKALLMNHELKIIFSANIIFYGEKERVAAKKKIDREYFPAFMTSINALKITANNACPLREVLKYFVAFQEIYYDKAERSAQNKLHPWEKALLVKVKSMFDMDFHAIGNFVTPVIDQLTSKIGDFYLPLSTRVCDAQVQTDPEVSPTASYSYGFYSWVASFFVSQKQLAIEAGQTELSGSEAGNNPK